MKTSASFFILATLVAMAVLVPTAHAQRQLGKKKGPTSKLYLAETKGEGQIVTDGKAFEPKQATAFDAPGTIIETRDDSHQAFVYSNGTGMYVDQNSRVVVDRFVQEPFSPDRNNTEMEPSVSQSNVFLARGMIGVCTGQMVSGSNMVYSTALANVNIRGGKVCIASQDDVTTVYLLDGDSTVRSGGKDMGGTLLHPGEKAVIKPGPAGQPPIITVGPIEASEMKGLDEKVQVACNARKTVTFEVIEKKSAAGAGGSTLSEEAASGSEEISANPTFPAAPPTNLTVSPSALGSGTGG